MTHHKIEVTTDVCPRCECGFSPPGQSMEQLWRNAIAHVDSGDRIAAGIRQYCSDLNTELAYHEPTRDTSLLQRFHDDAGNIARYISEAS